MRTGPSFPLINQPDREVFPPRHIHDHVLTPRLRGDDRAMGRGGRTPRGDVIAASLNAARLSPRGALTTRFMLSIP